MSDSSGVILCEVPSLDAVPLADIGTSSWVTAEMTRRVLPAGVPVETVFASGI